MLGQSNSALRRKAQCRPLGKHDELLNGGDDGTWSSPFITVLRLDAAAAASTTELFTVVFLFTTLGCYVWFVVEWVLALRVKRRLV